MHRQQAYDAFVLQVQVVLEDIKADSHLQEEVVKLSLILFLALMKLFELLGS